MEDARAGNGVNFEWLHLSEDEDGEPFKVYDMEVKDEDIYPNPSYDIKDKIAPRYYNAIDVNPSIQVLKDNIGLIREEVTSLLTNNEWTPWPEANLYNGEAQAGDWRVIPLLYTFPAYDTSSTKWVGSNCKLCPKTTELLKSIPNIRTALFSKMGAKTRLAAHQGWADLANYVLRCHLPIIVPENEKNLCGMWVDGHVNYHKEGELLMFDDSKWHKAFNVADKDRIILIFDVMRPDEIPKGCAEAGHTEKLDEFIAAFETLSTE